MTSAFGAEHGGPGDIFIRSAEYRRIKDPDARAQTFTTGPVRVSDGPLRTKGTLTEATAGGPGGGAVPPFYEPGIVSKLFEPLGAADLFGQSQTTASQVRYVNEGDGHLGCCRCGRGRGEARVDAQLLGGHGADPQGRDVPAGV